MKTIKQLDLKGKRVFVRVDFNVPMDEDGNITDDIRIRSVLPTLEYALAHDARLVVASHLGRPKGKKAPKFSMLPTAERLSRLLNQPVRMAPDCIGPEVKALVDGMRGGEIVMLENLRFHPEEEANEDGFARSLADLCDVYINDAFAVSHRANASVEAICKYVEHCGAGFLLEKEMDYFRQAMENPLRPLAAIVGGAKVSTKLAALENMLNKVDKLIIGGAMANTFLKSTGRSVGFSKIEEDLVPVAGKIMEQAKAKGVRLYLPVDVVIGQEMDARTVNKTVPVEEIPDGWMALDIGPASCLLFGEALQDVRTIIWNGPMGLFEIEAFGRGTRAMVDSVTRSHAVTVVGGGDTDLAVHQSGLADRITFISTGGGAFLELMEGKTLPGVEDLEKK